MNLQNSRRLNFWRTLPLLPNCFQILCIELFGAGGEPTSVTLKWAVRFLALNPAVQRRAQEEIAAAVGQDRPVAPSDRHSMPYVHALVSHENESKVA